MDEITKRKLKKLFLDPKNYFLDMRILQPFWKKLHLSKEDRKAKTTELSLQVVVKSLLLLDDPRKKTDPFVVVATPDNEMKPTAFAWNVPSCFQTQYARIFSEYSLVFVNSHEFDNDIKIRLAEMIDKNSGVPSTFLFHGRYENAEALDFAKQHSLDVHYTEEGLISSRTGVMSYVISKTPDPYGPALAELIRECPVSREQADEVSQAITVLKTLGYTTDMWKSCYPESTFFKDHPTYVVFFGATRALSGVVLEKERALLQTARDENPSDHIVYAAPNDHEELFQKNTALHHLLSEFDNISTQHTIPSNSLLKGARKAYTVSSPAAFWALFYQVPLAVAEPTFYSGHGLTEDRFQAEEQKEPRTLTELFYSACVAYPRYDSFLDGAAALLSNVLKTKALFDIKLRDSLAVYFTKSSYMIVDFIKFSDCWPLFLEMNNLAKLRAAHADCYQLYFQIEKRFSETMSEDHQEMLCYLFAGIFMKSRALFYLLAYMKKTIPADRQMKIIEDIHRIFPHAQVSEHLAWCYEKLEDLESARYLLENLFAAKKAALNFQDPLPVIAKENFKHALKLADLERRHGNLDRSRRLLFALLLNGYLAPAVFEQLATIARLRFSFSEAAFLYNIITVAYPSYKKGLFISNGAECALLAGDSFDALQKYAQYHNTSSYIVPLDFVANRLSRDCGPFDWKLILSALANNPASLAQAQIHINNEQFESALELLNNYTPEINEEVLYYSLLFITYAYLNMFDTIKATAGNLLAKSPNSAYFDMSLQAALHMRDYSWANALFDMAHNNRCSINTPLTYRIHYIRGNLHQALVFIAQLNYMDSFKRFMGKRYLPSLPDSGQSSVQSLVVLADSAVGDEIRGASLYRQIASKAQAENVTFTCDEKLFPVFQRSFPELRFLPFARFRHLAYIDDLSRFDEIPSSEFHWLMDNAVWRLVQDSDKVILHMDARPGVVTNYGSIDGKPYLKADPDQARTWRKTLRAQSDKPLVGLCWRSSLQSYARNVTALKMEELDRLLRTEGVQFVNCQYDGCNEQERRFLNERHPGRLLDVPGLDQFNDLDGTAALYCALDAMVSVPNTVAELAGALGVQTLMYTFTSEPDLLKVPGQSKNLYYHAVEHVGYDVPIGQRDKVIDLLVQKLQAVRPGKER